MTRRKITGLRMLCLLAPPPLALSVLLTGCGGGSTTTPPPQSLSIGTTSLPDGTIGTAYSQMIQATGGAAPLHWSVNSGTLPDNLNLGKSSTNSVSISGMPDLPQTAVKFTIQVTDSASQTATQSYSVNINNAPASAHIVETQSGQVQGVVQGNLVAFRGIPYAAPPIGNLRWRPPMSAAAWKGIKDASSFGNECPHINRDTNQLVGSEDCLVLNVFVSQTPQSQKQPVMVFIHGGGNSGGDTHQPPFDTPPLADHGVIVVTAEYRLGLLGSFANALLTAEDGLSSGNYLLLDQIAALNWVKQNIAAFGGDPAHVMAFGQSAGSADVQAVLVSPLAQGLFSVAATESGLLLHGDLFTLATVEAADNPFVSSVGCNTAADVLACLRAVPASTIVSNQAPYANNDIIIEPRVIPVDPFDVLQQHGSPVPLLTGGTREEFAGLGEDPNAPLTPSGYAALIHTEFDPAGAGVADHVLFLYPATTDGSPAYARIAVDSDFRGACLVRDIARAATGANRPPVWRYFYTHRFENDPSLAAFRAFHRAELFFVFGNLNVINAPYSPTNAELTFAEQMMGYWTRFAATGDPNGAGATQWPRYDPTTDGMLQLDDIQMVINGYHSPQCDYFATLPPLP